MKSSRAGLRSGGSLDGKAKHSSSRDFARFSYAANVLLLVYLFVLNTRSVDRAERLAGKTNAESYLKFSGAVSDLANSTAALENTIKVLHEVTNTGSAKPHKTSSNPALLPVVVSHPLPVIPPLTWVQSTGSSPQPASSPGTTSAEKLWMFLGIPTVPRRNNVDYLTTTLRTMLDQMPADPSDPFSSKVKAVIMNNKPGAHQVYNSARAMFEQIGGPKARFLEFRDNPGLIPDPAPELPDPDDLNNPTSRPGREVRKQTCDLIALMELGAAQAEYYMFMEDDFRVCPHFLRAVHYVVEKSNLQTPDWLAIRVSYGMNGIIMKSKDLLLLSKYLREHTARLPPDLLWQEWMAKAHSIPELRGRPLLVYKHNLLDHIGTISSFAIRPNRPKWPGCYESMANVWSLTRMEQFDRNCVHDDISPCNKKELGPDWTDKHINFHP